MTVTGHAVRTPRGGSDPEPDPIADPKERAVTYVIGEPCIDIVDRACVDECPVDCIYEGDRALYIHPDECVDCGACEPFCPVEAIFYEDDLPDVLTPYLTDNETFFNQVLSGREAPIGSPGGAAKMGRLGVDTALVASHPLPDEQS
jgi:NAD-dependent dihydropyrimidine dehydrogenase PreA subunit